MFFPYFLIRPFLSAFLCPYAVQCLTLPQSSLLRKERSARGDGKEENRPFHWAYLSRKLPCSHILCRAELGRAVFEETRLVQHVRVKHAGVKCDEKFEREAWRLFRFKHGEETKNHVEWLSTRRLTKSTSLVSVPV